MQTGRDQIAEEDVNLLAILPSEIMRLILNKLPLKKVSEFLQINTFLTKKYSLETKRVFLYNYAISELYLPSELHTYFRTRGGRVYGCGENSNNRLGVGNRGRRLLPEQLASLKDVAQVFCYKDSAFFLNRDGSLFAVGKNSAGQLGVGDSMHKSSPVEIKGLPPIKKVIVCANYTFFLAHNGDVYVCGDNSTSMLGVRGLSKTNHCIPHKLTDVSDIEDIVIHSDKVYFTSKSGKVHAFGANSSGYLGMNDKIERDFPEQIKALDHVIVKQVFVNGWSTFFLTDTGQVYACGSNEGGRLGCGDAAECISPQLIAGLPPIKKIFMCDYHTFFLAENGDVYVCGKNLAGELGIGDLKECHTPQKLTNLSNIADIHFDSKHTYFLHADGNVFACGLNVNGELGFLDKKPRTRPELVTSVSRVSGIRAFGGSAFFHTRLQKTFVAGKNKSGELGLGSRDEGVLLQVNHALDGVASTYLDSSSAMSLRADGQVLASGENREGELGLPELNVYPTPRVVMFNDVISEIEKWPLADIIALADIAADSLRHYLVNRAIDLVANLDNEENIANILPALRSGFWMQQVWVETLFPCYMSALQLTESCKSAKEKQSLLKTYARILLLHRELQQSNEDDAEFKREQFAIMLQNLAGDLKEKPQAQSLRLFGREQNTEQTFKLFAEPLAGLSIDEIIAIAKLLTAKIVLPAGSKRPREGESNEYETPPKRKRVTQQ